ncbi:MAG: peroxiredoxin family protein [Actinomycetota bacterium]
MPCLQQIVDLQNDGRFERLPVALLSISPDPVEAWAEEADALGIQMPLLSDPGNRVAREYGVMRWAMPSGEPGHTFVLVGEDGRVLWIRDYGSPENGGLMYVEVPELLGQVAARLGD